MRNEKTLEARDVMKAGDLIFGWTRIPAELVGQKVGRDRRGFVMRPIKRRASEKRGAPAATKTLGEKEA